MNETNVHAPSKMITGRYFKRIEATNAIEAPIKFIGIGV
jgi:hypothetical protein